MKVLWIALAASMLAGCAVVPLGGYPYAAVPAPGVSVGVGVAVPIYRPHYYYRGYYGRRYHGPYYGPRWQPHGYRRR
jgi:hypothetical protein